MKYRIAVPKASSRARILCRAVKCLFTGQLELEISVNQAPAPTDTDFVLDEFVQGHNDREISRWQHAFDIKMRAAREYVAPNQRVGPQ